MVDALAIRDDLIVTMVASDSAAPGLFDGLGASITLDASRLLPADVDPATMDFGDLRTLARTPIVAGCLAHEVGHADHTVTRKRQQSPAESWATLLEEPRIETIMAHTRPQTRTWLQAAVAHLLGEVAPTSAEEAARVLILLGGRLLGNVLDDSDDLDLDAACGEWLTAQQVAVIADATSIAVTLADGDIAGMLRQAERIAAVMPNTQAPPVGEGHGDSQSGDDDGQDDGDRRGQTGSRSGDQTRTTAAGKRLARAIKQVAEGATTDMQASAGILGASPAARARADEARARASQVRAAAAKARRTHHRVTDRTPTASEQRQLTHLIRRLRRAEDRGVDVTVERSVSPPGGLNSSELMQRAAQRATGGSVTAKPWERRYRRERPHPKLTVGIAADISPSQDNIVDQVGVATWMLNRAAQDRGGQSATVTWHSTAAVLPTKRGATVPVASTGGMSEGLPEALRALDGLLHLTTQTSTPRLVVVITDAQLPNAESIYAEVARLIASGVKVLWLVDRDTGIAAIEPPHGVTAASVTDPSTIGAIIADAMVAALRS
ncbi:hypothetical protein [Gordonia alkanivorans]|uniref:hypothetical protein n=1 Tax=Gordonia alkanivorans TaxID=84096 RepID=UPI0004AD136E|nr:hypothetical protein [Gordonia alkanivorans]